jgi:hypothetical protein
MMQGINNLLFHHACYVACAMSSAVFSFSLPVRADAITISQWSHTVLVDPPVGYDDDGWTTVENPCHRTISAQVGNSVSSSTLDFAWAEQFGRFLIHSNQVAVGASSGTTYTSASGSIRLVVTEPLSLNINAFWTYQLPADFMMSGFGVSIRSLTDQTLLFHEEYHPQTWPGDPWSGTLTIQGDVTLTPGHTWRLSYNMDLEADAGPNFSATGNGYVNLTITPEVSTLALLVPLLLVVSRRATRHRRAGST